MNDIKDKIRKLLALTESPEEGEAKAALLKARDLMMKYRLSELDLKDAKADQKIVELSTGVTCTKLVDPWITSLAGTIANKHRCECFMRTYHGRKQKEMIFLGFEEDVEIARDIFYYARVCIYSEIDKMRKEAKRTFGYTTSQMRSATDSYAKGFIRGIIDAYNAQKDEHPEWALVAVVPKEAQDRVSSMGSADMSCRSRLDTSAADHGYQDGLRFDPSNKLNESHAELHA